VKTSKQFTGNLSNSGDLKSYVVLLLRPRSLPCFFRSTLDLPMFFLLFHNIHNWNFIHPCFRNVEASIKCFSIPPDGSEPLKFSSRYSQDRIFQFLTCLWKQNLIYWRTPPYNGMRLCFTTISALVLGLIFWNVGSKR
jgi:hypothetical protein